LIYIIKIAFKEINATNRLHVVTSGETAIDSLNNRKGNVCAPRPDLILLDLNLPKKDGRKLLYEVKADDKLKAIPIIVLSTSELKTDISNAYSNCANGYLIKPLEHDELIKAVKATGSFCSPL
jgi:CheY-like chemotaxis protein